MKALKFRVWNIEDKLWDNPVILEVWSEKGVLEPFQYISTGELNPLYIPKENYIIQQFTGLKDKNNKEIYEGDLINFTLKGIAHGPESEDIKDAEVFWDEKNLCFCFGRYKTNDGLDYSFCFADRIDRNNIEVVGNIFKK